MPATEYATTRSQDEIVARIKAHEAGEDFFGFAREALIDALDFDHAKPYLKDGVTAQEWQQVTDFGDAAREYLAFAIGKIEAHRGISAERSVSKLTEYAWLLGRDDVVSAMDAADYPNYGAPKVKAFAEGMGFPWPDDKELARMARGESCVDDCEGGCGR